jgi:peroxiredoxin Q/BCP
LTGLASGLQAPDFRLAKDGGGTVSLSDFHGRKLVLFFYPRAGSTGCTREAVAFSALAPAFATAKTALLGVSADPVAALDRFKAKQGLALVLASDPDHVMLEAYGVWGKKKLYGKIHWGVVRTTFLIDPKGRIVRIWPKVSIDGHADEVLAAARDS